MSVPRRFHEILMTDLAHVAAEASRVESRGRSCAPGATALARPPVAQRPTAPRGGTTRVAGGVTATCPEAERAHAELAALARAQRLPFRARPSVPRPRPASRIGALPPRTHDEFCVKGCYDSHGECYEQCAAESDPEFVFICFDGCDSALELCELGCESGGDPGNPPPHPCAPGTPVEQCKFAIEAQTGG